MLAPAPYQEPVGEGKVESEKTRGDLRSGGKLDTESGEIDISSPEDKGEREASIPSPFRKKRANLKVGRGGLLRGARCHRRAAQDWKATPLNSSVMRTSPQPNRK